MAAPFIAMSAVMGAGKSTFCKRAQKHFENLTLVEELVHENPYFLPFCNDTTSYAFRMEVCSPILRIQQQSPHEDEGILQDRSLPEDPIFAKILYEGGYLNRVEYILSLVVFLRETLDVRRPDLLVYLKVQPETALARIRMRNREGEDKIGLEYLQRLCAGYDEWIKRIREDVEVLEIQYDEFIDTEVVVKRIQEDLPSPIHPQRGFDRFGAHLLQDVFSVLSELDPSDVKHVEAAERQLVEVADRLKKAVRPKYMPVLEAIKSLASVHPPSPQRESLTMRAMSTILQLLPGYNLTPPPQAEDGWDSEADPEDDVEAPADVGSDDDWADPDYDDYWEEPDWDFESAQPSMTAEELEEFEEYAQLLGY